MLLHEHHPVSSPRRAIKVRLWKLVIVFSVTLAMSSVIAPHKILSEAKRSLSWVERGHADEGLYTESDLFPTLSHSSPHPDQLEAHPGHDVTRKALLGQEFKRKAPHEGDWHSLVDLDPSNHAEEELDENASHSSTLSDAMHAYDGRKRLQLMDPEVDLRRSTSRSWQPHNEPPTVLTTHPKDSLPMEQQRTHDQSPAHLLQSYDSPSVHTNHIDSMSMERFLLDEFPDETLSLMSSIAPELGLQCSFDQAPSIFSLENNQEDLSLDTALNRVGYEFPTDLLQTTNFPAVHLNNIEHVLLNDLLDDNYTLDSNFLAFGSQINFNQARSNPSVGANVPLIDKTKENTNPESPIYILEDGHPSTQVNNWENILQHDWTEIAAQSTLQTNETPAGKKTAGEVESSFLPGNVPRSPSIQGVSFGPSSIDEEVMVEVMDSVKAQDWKTFINHLNQETARKKQAINAVESKVEIKNKVFQSHRETIQPPSSKEKKAQENQNNGLSHIDSVKEQNNFRRAWRVILFPEIPFECNTVSKDKMTQYKSFVTKDIRRGISRLEKKIKVHFSDDTNELQKKLYYLTKLKNILSGLLFYVDMINTMVPNENLNVATRLQSQREIACQIFLSIIKNKVSQLTKKKLKMTKDKIQRSAMEGALESLDFTIDDIHTTTQVPFVWKMISCWLLSSRKELLSKNKSVLLDENFTNFFDNLFSAWIIS